MKCFASSLLLIAILYVPRVYAQGKILYGASSGVAFVSVNNVPSQSGLPSYVSGPGIALEIGIDIGYFDWDRLSYSAQVLIDGSAGFIEIPVVVKYPVMQGSWKGYFFGGPILGLLLGQGSYKFLFPLDIGIYGGVGFTHHLDSDVDFFIEAGYSFGLINLSSPYTSYPSFGANPSYYKEYSREFHLYLGILFGS
jgi:hypothetical protein